MVAKSTPIDTILGSVDIGFSCRIIDNDIFQLGDGLARLIGPVVCEKIVGQELADVDIGAVRNKAEPEMGGIRAARRWG